MSEQQLYQDQWVVFQVKKHQEHKHFLLKDFSSHHWTKEGQGKCTSLSTL